MIFKIIKKIRKLRKISATDFAKDLEINRVTLFRFEKGEKEISEGLKIGAMESLRFSKKRIYHILILEELIRLKVLFGDDEGGDAQLVEILKNFTAELEEDAIVLDIVKNAIKRNK